MFRAVALVALVLAGGCLQTQACDAGPLSATWNEPGLFAEVSASQPHLLYEARGFNWTRADLDAAFAGHYALTEVHRNGTDLDIWLRPGGHLVVLGGPQTNASHIAAALAPLVAHPDEALLRDLSWQVAQQVIETQGLDGNDKHAGARYAARGYLAPPYAFGDVAGLDVEMGVGAHRLLQDEWRLTLQLDRVSMPMNQGDTSVDATDAASAWVSADHAEAFATLMESTWGRNLTFADLVVSQQQIC